MASAFGVKLGSYPTDVLRKSEIGKAQSQMMEIDRNIGGLKRERLTNRISSEEFDSKARVELDKKTKVQRELMEKLN